jgi:hypothetical protein
LGQAGANGQFQPSHTVHPFIFPFDLFQMSSKPSKIPRNSNKF